MSDSAFPTFFKSVFDSIPSSKGRIVIDPTSSNDCLTVTNPSDSDGPFYVKSEKCTSDTKPSLAQTWGYGNDFGNVIFWVKFFLKAARNVKLTLPFIRTVRVVRVSL
jgi:hypothetical protein